MINEIDKDPKAAANSEPAADPTSPSGSGQGDGGAAADPANPPKKPKKKKKSSALAAAAMGRSAVGAVMPRSSLDIRGSSPLINSGPDVSDND